MPGSADSTRRTLLVGMAAFCLVPIPMASAAAPDAAARLVRDLGEASIAMLRDRTVDRIERRARFAALVERGFDLPTIARLSIGARWKVMTGADRQAYVELFRLYVLDSYARRLDAYRDQTLRVGGSMNVGQDEMVESWIEGDGEPVRVDWRVRATVDGPRIVDIVVAGVSMVLTQRSEFASIIEREGGTRGLIEHLRRQVEGVRQARAG
jgi:phospholipid transport system substrate-binding protein